MMTEGSRQGDAARPFHALVTGATGYIGGRLVPRLLERGYRVRCLVRAPKRLQGRLWQDAVEVAVGDVLQPDTLSAAMEGMDVAYYLVHSMAGGTGFPQRDIIAARNFGQAARAAGVKRIVYLGGLASGGVELSEHLRSRQETGDVLRASGVPITEFRAGVIVGSGSISFEMVRYLVERIPVLIGPRWVYTRAQPIAVREVLEYLIAALQVPESAGRIVEIGGADVVTYRDMMMIYAEERGLKRWALPVPVLTPRVSSYWVNLVTPIPASIARPLIEGLRNENIVQDHSARELFPAITPVGYRVAVQRALVRLDAQMVETAWSDAVSTIHGDTVPFALTNFEGMIVEKRQRTIEASAEAAYAVFSEIGGDRGWFCMNWAWKLRAVLDRLIGGVGMRRGRRDPDFLRVGDALDFWRVEAVEPDHLIRLRAEMKLPGQAWLQFQVHAIDDGRAILTQTACFAPKGLFGHVYWYALYPFHRRIFSGLIEEIARRATARAFELNPARQ